MRGLDSPPGYLVFIPGMFQHCQLNMMAGRHQIHHLFSYILFDVCSRSVLVNCMKYWCCHCMKYWCSHCIYHFDLLMVLLLHLLQFCLPSALLQEELTLKEVWLTSFFQHMTLLSPVVFLAFNNNCWVDVLYPSSSQLTFGTFFHQTPKVSSVFLCQIS